MKLRKNKNKKMYRLLVLFLTAILLTTTSYAWFSSNRKVSLNSLNIRVKSAGGIEISTDGANWKAEISVDDIKNARKTYPNSLNQLPDKIEPVSTTKTLDTNGYLSMYYGTVDMNAIGGYTITSVKSIAEESSGENSKGHFVTFDLFLKSINPKQLFLSPESKVTYFDNKSVGSENSIRIAFINQGNTQIGSPLGTIQNLKTSSSNDISMWEPNYDSHTLSAVAHAKDTYGININTGDSKIIPYDGIASEIAEGNNIDIRKANSLNYPEFFKPVVADYKTKSNFNNNEKIFNIETGITKIRIYMWMEGQDVDCENDASVGNVVFNMNFEVDK